MQPFLLNGAKCTISADGVPIAAAFVADYRLDTQAQELDVIDWVFPIELMPSRISASMNLRVYRTSDNDAVITNIAPGSASIGQTEQSAFLATRYIKIEIKDNYDNTILVLPKAMVVSRSGSMSAGEFLIENWSIKGIGFYGPQG